MQPMWISIKDKFPDLWESVIVVSEDGFVDITSRTDCEKWLYEKSPVKYWMEIPAIDNLDGVTKDKWMEKYK